MQTAVGNTLGTAMNRWGFCLPSWSWSARPDWNQIGSFNTQVAWVQHPTWENTSWKRVISVCLADVDRTRSHHSLQNLSINTSFSRTKVTCSVLSFISYFSEFHFLLILLSSPFQGLNILTTWQYRSNEQNQSLQNWPTIVTREKLTSSARCGHLGVKMTQTHG